MSAGNSNFGVNYLINKENLHRILQDKNIRSTLSPIHSCVNIKHKISNDETYISIFVFQTGNIIITGTLGQTIDGYSNMIITENNSSLGLISDSTNWYIF